MAVRRDEVESTWLVLLDGRSSREDAVRWAAEMENEHSADDIMVEVGLQNLANLDRRIWPEDSRRPEARPGEYIELIGRVTQLFEGWKENCVAYDADPNAGSVFLSEDADYSDDFRVTYWTGTFSGSWQGADLLHSPRSLSAVEAIAWGRARSSRVFIRPRDGVHYAAGSASRPDDVPWPENMDLSPRADTKEGLEWMDRTDDDDPIEMGRQRKWPYVPPHTTTEAFLYQFRVTLEADSGINLKSIERPPDHPAPRGIRSPSSASRPERKTRPNRWLRS